MGLIANPPAPASPEGSTIAADGWFPEIDCNACRAAMRMGTVVTHARLKFAVVGALLSTMGDLSAWKADQVDAGAANLAAVEPDAMVAGEHRLTALFRRAIYCYAAADLAEQHRDITATDDGDGRAEEILPAAADFRRLAIQAIRDIQNTTRIGVELI